MGILIPEDAKQIAEATFHCSICEALATHVELFVSSSIEEGRSGEPGGFLRAMGFIGEIEMVVSAEKIDELQGYMRRKSAQEMHEIYIKYAPCFCLQCERAYCKDHWVMSLEFDDGFYDCTRGSCPAGHEQLLDD